MYAEFKNEKILFEFMDFLMTLNTEKNQQVIYSRYGLTGLKYDYQYVIFNDIYDMIENKIIELKR